MAAVDVLIFCVVMMKILCLPILLHSSITAGPAAFLMATDTAPETKKITLYTFLEQARADLRHEVRFCRVIFWKNLTCMLVKFRGGLENPTAGYGYNASHIILVY